MAEDRLAQLKRGVVDCIDEDEFASRLAKGGSLRVKLGMDPTAPDIHLGHTVVLNKLRQFQEYGHQVIFIIGDFTAMVGDPSGKNKTRPPLSREEIQHNTATYQEQVFHILDPDQTEVVFNSTWMSQVPSDEMIRLASTYTVARMLERDDFHKRYTTNQPISLHEFMYPLIQGYDSVHIRSDIELGGTDQKFNLLVGRDLQKHYGQEPQCLMTMPLLEGLDGVRKMSKSLGNYIGVTEAPGDMFGKSMSVSDELMWRYFEILELEDAASIAQRVQAVEGGENPRNIKLDMAEIIVARFHGQSAGAQARQAFIEQFSQKTVPTDLPIQDVVSKEQSMAIGYLLKSAGLVSSTSEALRLVKQGAVRIDGEKVSDPKLQLEVESLHTYQVGKHRVARIRVVGVANAID